MKNGKYFVAPQKTTDNFKVLFARLAAQGAGRPVDESGFADGPWTPETLADAITSLDTKAKGVELRTVQLWFQDNDHGISDDNMRWLARIFGCNDPDATSEWQAELKASKDRLSSERRAKRKRSDHVKGSEQDANENRLDPPSKPKNAATHGSPATSEAADSITGINLPLRCEAMFGGPNSLNLPIAVWGGLGVLWFLAFTAGVHNVTYSTQDVIQKQVGFSWSPAWVIGEPIFLPMFLIVASGLISRWRHSDREHLISIGQSEGIESWRNRIKSQWLSYWAILLICFVLIFLVQWTGVYLLPLLENDPDVVMIDWLLIALVEPDTLSTNAAIGLSFLGFLYSGMIYWFLFTGLLLLYTVSVDFFEICSSRTDSKQGIFNEYALLGAIKIMRSIFHCTILGILIALTIKVNAAYLVTDSKSIITWLLHDASLAFRFRDDEWNWINGSPSPFLTSFLLLFLIGFVYAACFFLIKSGLDLLTLSPQDRSNLRRMWTKMSTIITSLAVAYLLVGQFFGFSIILGLSVAGSLLSLLWKFEPHATPVRGT